jgi:DNA-3-methyladenine glycosylase I
MNLKSRCGWVNLKNPLYIRYHDEEWGKPLHDEQKHFEFLMLESFQAGLSWEIILNRREGFRKAFARFDAQKIALFTEHDVKKLLENSEIIRSELKIKSAIENAKIFLAIQQEWGTFDRYLWHFTEGKIVDNHPKTLKEIPASNPLSERISQDLRKRGMKFMGPVIVYAHLQAVGVINDHVENCYCREPIV